MNYAIMKYVKVNNRKRMKRLLTFLLCLAAMVGVHAEGTVYYGYCPQTLDTQYLSAVGTGENGLLQVSICLDPAADPAMKRLEGQKILGVRLFMRAAYTTSQRASDRFVFSTVGSPDAEMTKTSCKFQEGWNDVMFQSPLVIGSEPIYLGASVYETFGTPYPFGVYNSAEVTGTYLCNVKKEGWMERKGSVLLLEAILDASESQLSAPDGLLSATAHVSFKGSELTVQPSQSAKGLLYVHNQSAQPISTVSFTTTDGAGVASNHIIDLSGAPLQAFDARVVPFQVTSPSLNGTEQPLTFSVKEVKNTEGKSLDAAGRGLSFTTTFYVMDDAFTRVPLVEEFTSQYCINCPFMIYYLDRAMEAWREAGNPVLYVTHHSGFQNDMFTQPVDQALTYLFGPGETTYNPAVMYDRRIFAGNNSPVVSAKVAETTPYTESIAAVSQVPAMAEVNVRRSDDGTTLTVEGRINRNFAAEGIPVYLTCYLIEDGIPTKPYFQMGLTDFEDAPDDLEETFRHNGVVRHVFTKEALGDAITIERDGEVCFYSMTFPWPEKLSPLPILDESRTDVVAFVHLVDTDVMASNYVLNAGSMKLTANADGIGTVTAGTTANAASSECYDLQGRRVNPKAAYKGVYIQNGNRILKR